MNFAGYLCFYVPITIMAAYAAKEFAAGDALAGLASSSFVVGATIARIFSGYVVDSVGKKPVLLVALGCVVLANLAYIPTHALGLLIACRVIHGIAYAFASTAVMAVAQSVIPSHRRAEGTGYFALGATLATAVGPALGLMLSARYSFTVVFVVSAAISVVGFVLALAIRFAAEPTRERQAFTVDRVINPRVVPIGVFMLFIGVAYSSVLTFINPYTETKNLGTGASLFFIAYAVMMLVMRFFLGRVQDKRGDNVVVYLGLVAFIACLVLLACASANWQVVVAGVLAGLGYGTLMPASQAIAVRLVEPQQFGSGISTLFLLLDAGVGLGPLGLGSVVAARGYSFMYILAAVLAVAGAVFYYFAHGRKELARPRSNAHA